MACRADRLSDLPDDLLLRVLRFAPTKEAASTTALSQGWRSPLWRSSGAVNLETRAEVYHDIRYGFGPDERKKQEADEALFFSRRDAFISSAEAALDAADVTRLAVRLEFHGRSDTANMFLHGDIDRDRVNRNRVDRGSDRDVITKLISHHAARQVEELQLATEDWRGGNGADKEDEITSSRERGKFTLSLASLPSDTLRVLELTGCKGLVPYPPASGLVFARLTLLRLRHCTLQIDALQSLIDAAPALAAIHIECVTIAQKTNTSNSLYGCNRPPPSETVLLRCPAATVLELDGCCLKVNDRPWHTKNTIVAVEIDAPRLQRFRFRGIVRPVSLSPPPPDLAYADLVTFWRILHSFANARELKLRVTALEHIAVLSKARRSELLPVLPNLHRLELEGVHRPKGKTAAVAIGNLLRCCPALRDLRINLTVAHHEPKYWHSKDIYLTEWLPGAAARVGTDSSGPGVTSKSCNTTSPPARATIAVAESHHLHGLLFSAGNQVDERSFDASPCLGLDERKDGRHSSISVLVISTGAAASTERNVGLRTTAASQPGAGEEGRRGARFDRGQKGGEEGNRGGRRGLRRWPAWEALSWPASGREKRWREVR